jgi:hypothetical protein
MDNTSSFAKTNNMVSLAVQMNNEAVRLLQENNRN